MWWIAGARGLRGGLVVDQAEEQFLRGDVRFGGVRWLIVLVRKMVVWRAVVTGVVFLLDLLLADKYAGNCWRGGLVALGTGFACNSEGKVKIMKARTGIAVATLAALVWCMAGVAFAQERVSGELLDPSAYGASYVESMQAVIDRDRLAPRPLSGRVRQAGEQGVWIVPSRGASGAAHSGSYYAANKWGDTRMGIGFDEVVDVHGAWFAGQGGSGVWAPAVRVHGYRDGEVVGRSEWFDRIGAEPAWFEMNLAGVDRIEIEALPAVDGGGWYALDDLTYAAVDKTGDAKMVVVTFDDLSYRYKLTGSGYAGLTWEFGTGLFGDEGVPAPKVMGAARDDVPEGEKAEPSGRNAVAPNLLAVYQGVIRGDAGSMSYPPDTDGAIGPDHYVETVNRNFAVYDKETGDELTNVLLGSFLPGSNGDPRVVYDQYSGRWIVHVTDFNATATIFLAVSLSSDPMGDWFKTSFLTAQGGDAGRWPDYPTLGVNETGIYIGAYMVGGGTMTLFAIDKAPLVQFPPQLGTVAAFRNLPWEGALQPTHSYGDGAGAYVVSVASSTSLRVRRIDPPMSNPVKVELGYVTVPYFTTAPNAPAQGSSTPLNTVDDRLMMSVYRDGSIWTAHTIEVSGRAGCRWYEIDAETLDLVQSGTVADDGMYYYFPSIMVNAAGDAAMGFTGSNSGMYASCYYTGRLAADPLGEMAPPVLYREGEAAQNNIDGYGRNRWGDYSYTTLDPDDEMTFWTIQEYGHDVDIWGTAMAVLSPEPPDCNDNGVPDWEDIANGTSQDCNENGIPDECEPDEDCNGNGSPDFCDLIDGTSQDCNFNGIPDECDISAGVSEDCQPNGIPDECEIGSTEVVISFPLDSNPGWDTQGMWAWGSPTGSGGEYGGPDPTSGYSGPNVYGYNLNGDYENNLPERHLTTDAIDCSQLTDVRLSFYRWLGVEQPVYDHAYVRVSTNGSSWQTIWENTEEVTDYAWQYQEFDISAIADNQPTVYIRWTMGTTDVAWQYCGWNIDDIELRGEGPGGGEGDCNANSVPDACDIASGYSDDCNGNAVPDECDIANGTSEDTNGNGVPDECEGQVPGDMNCDGAVDFDDINPFVLAISGQAAYEAEWPDCEWLNADVDGDGTVDFDDINPFVALLGG